MKKRKSCNGNCEKFRVTKPSKMGRYESGQGRCQTCAIWIDHNGCHLKGGAAATAESKGWFCNCCNYRVRRNPRNSYYKIRLRSKKTDKKHADNKNNMDSEYVERINQITAKVIPQIKKEKNIYASDIRASCNITQAEMPDIITKITRIEGMTKKEIHYDDTLLDVLLSYESADESQYMEPQDIEDLAIQVASDHVSNKRIIDKSLQRRLTMEYIQKESIEKIIENHPEISKNEIKRHIRTPKRLPTKLRRLNEEGLHPDPEYSLQIALFSVNYHDWDGQEDMQDDVIRMAVAIAKKIASDPSLNAPSGRSRHKKMSLDAHGDTVPAAIAVWIAAATLHKEHGMDAVFPNNDIINMVFQQRLCSASQKTISDHVSGHCVANAPTTTSAVHRKLYRVGPGMYRLYKKGDPYNHTRENCKMAPLKLQLPQQYSYLREWYDEEYCKS